MRSFLFPLLAGAFSLTVACATTRSASDEEKLQGIWKVVSVEDGGRKPSDDTLKDLKWVVTKDKITYMVGDKATEWSTKLDPTKTPKWIDLTQGDRTSLAIYELEGDNLKICFPEGRKGERATAFESKPNSVNDVLIVLKRKEP